MIRASVNGIHNPRDVRYRMGRYSAEGYYRDSFDCDRLREVLLDPLCPNGSRRYVAAVHDVATDQPVEMDERIAAVGSVFVCDGIFLHRPELADYWDCSVFLEC